MTTVVECNALKTASGLPKPFLVFEPHPKLGSQLRASPGLTLNIHYPSSGNLTNHSRHRSIAFSSLMVRASLPTPCIPTWNQIARPEKTAGAAIMSATIRSACRKLRG
jgi:hypothetical protein